MTVGVTLTTGGAGVAAVQNDIGFDSSIATVAATVAGRPDCQVNPAISKSASAFAFRPPGCRPGVDCNGIRAVVVSADNVDPIADGALLYTCTVHIAGDAPPGSYQLTIPNLLASDPTGAQLPVQGTAGELAVLTPPGATPIPTRTRIAAAPPPTATPDVQVHVGSATGKPGESVTIAVTLSTAGHAVAGLQNDITADGGIHLVGCAVNADLHKELTAFAYSSSGLRAIVVGENVDPIPDGAVLYTCTVDIPLGTFPHSYRLINSHIVVAAPNGDPLPVTGTDGAVVVLPPPTRTPTQTWTPSPTGTITPTPTPLLPSIDLSRAFGNPGARAAVVATLNLRGVAVATTQNDITFTPNAPIGPGPGGKPDCSVNPNIGKEGAFAFLPNGCRGTVCSGVRALVFSAANLDTIPDGAVLYTCRIDIAANVTGTFPLTISNVVLTTPESLKLPASGANGAVSVGVPTPGAVAPAIALATDSAHPGEPMRVSVLLYTGDAYVWAVDSWIAFDSDNAPIAANADGTPDCAVNPDSGTVGAFVFQPQGCNQTDCTSTWARLFRNELSPLPDGVVLYTCTVNVSPQAAGSISLRLSATLDLTPPGLFGEFGPPLTANANGTVTVEPRSEPQQGAGGAGCSIVSGAERTVAATWPLPVSTLLLIGLLQTHRFAKRRGG